jgi:SAM-dependent methyltransferase/mannose-6-phosphate isomerase-like protein (cupin superfamily)
MLSKINNSGLSTSISRGSAYMRYVHSLPASASFSDTGLSGYIFGPLNDPSVEVCYIDVRQGHDTFQISRKIKRIYYVLSGTGYFTITGCRYEVTSGTLVEVPPGLEYSYSGTMKLIAFMTPRWFVDNDTATKWNPDVTPQNLRFEPGNGLTWQSKLLGFQIFGKSPFRAYLGLSHRIWEKLPLSLTTWRPIRSYGVFVHKLVRMKGGRAQGLGTCFLRNRPALELIRRLAERRGKEKTLRLAVLGCSAGAEVYSIAWTIKSARPDLKLELDAMDISEEVVEFARDGIYPVKPTKESSGISDPAVLERMSNAEVDQLFSCEAEFVKVKPWIGEGINWRVGDVGNPGIVEDLGTYDIVVANNFLCHMSPGQAERCLRNIARLVKHGGHLLVGGIDLDVRTKVACQLGWRPVEELLEDIHNGDIWLRILWPWHYAGLEPLDKARPDWKVRYAAAFELFAADTLTDQNEIDSVAQVRC